MGRPPCCDKVGIKKGPWTPEEDIILVSYIQEHGPGNWRSVPTNTGLMRCSKSCRLRWTNYLRPGIKRGNFTPHEEGMIIHLQALLGNKWAAIASYLPQRTDNDIKNYWNTHLKKKLKKFQSALEPQNMGSNDSTINVQLLPRSPFSDQRSLDFSNDQLGSTRANQPNNSTTYASSTENISRLLEGWMRSSSNSKNSTNLKEIAQFHDHEEEEHKPQEIGNSSAMDSLQFFEPKTEIEGEDLVSHEEFDPILSFQIMNNNNNVTSWERSSGDSSTQNYKRVISHDSVDHEINYEINDDHNKIDDQVVEIEKNNINVSTPPLSFLEKWLLDESTSANHVEEMMELSSMF